MKAANSGKDENHGVQRFGSHDLCSARAVVQRELPRFW
jgi:hypothetical protein